MVKIDESKYLKIRALILAVDKCLVETKDADEEIENATMLSEMLVEIIREIDKKR